jgi:hypothetical protein
MKEFKCASCGVEFIGARTEEECTQEMHENFGEDMNTSDCDVVCEDCYQDMKKAYGW